MRAVVQRVSEATVEVEGRQVARIGLGLLVFIGIGRNDTPEDADFLAKKIGKLRIFSDAEERMNRDLEQAGGALLVVSQFTLYADTSKGHRPSYSEAARPEIAKPLYEYFLSACRNAGYIVESGIFQTSMRVSLVNEGPVTLVCSSG